MLHGSHTRVVDQDLNPAEVVQYPLCRLTDLILIGHIGRIMMAMHPLIFQLPFHLLEPLFPPGRQCYCSATSPQGPGKLHPETARRTRDNDGDLPPDIKSIHTHHPLFPFHCTTGS